MGAGASSSTKQTANPAGKSKSKRQNSSKGSVKRVELPTVEEFTKRVNCYDSEGWKRTLAQKQLDVFTRVSPNDKERHEVCVRARFVSSAAPVSIFDYLSKLGKRTEWDIFFRDGSLIGDSGQHKTYKMLVGGIVPYVERQVIVHQLSMKSDPDSLFIVEKCLESDGAESEANRYEVLSGFWIQRLSTTSSMVISVHSFELERVVPSVFHSMADADTASFVASKYQPCFVALMKAITDHVGTSDSTAASSPVTNRENSGNGEGARGGASGKSPGKGSSRKQQQHGQSPSTMTLTEFQATHIINNALRSPGDSHDSVGTGGMSSVSSGDAIGGSAELGSGEFSEEVLRSTSSFSLKNPIDWRRGELIGAGAIGKVYMALNVETGKLMAVKQVMLASASPTQVADLQSLEQEIEMFKTLKHPNIIEYIGVERGKEQVSIFLEYVPGGSIQTMLKKFGAFAEGMVRVYTRQIVAGLAYLHSNSICHRDIKGANILCANEGVVKLADFGASKKIADLYNTSTGLRSLVGTPYMMAPEVIKQSGHGTKADIWSLGCVVIEMATGLPPWSQFKDRMAAMFHIANAKGPPPLPDTMGSQLQSFVAACMQLNPKDRPPATALLKHPFLMEDDAPSPTRQAISTHFPAPSPGAKSAASHSPHGEGGNGGGGGGGGGGSSAILGQRLGRRRGDNSNSPHSKASPQNHARASPMRHIPGMALPGAANKDMSNGSGSNKDGVKSPSFNGNGSAFPRTPASENRDKLPALSPRASYVTGGMNGVSPRGPNTPQSSGSGGKGTTVSTNARSDSFKNKLAKLGGSRKAAHADLTPVFVGVGGKFGGHDDSDDDEEEHDDDSDDDDFDDMDERSGDSELENSSSDDEDGKPPARGGGIRARLQGFRKGDGKSKQRQSNAAAVAPSLANGTGPGRSGGGSRSNNGDGMAAAISGAGVMMMRDGGNNGSRTSDPLAMARAGEQVGNVPSIQDMRNFFGGNGTQDGTIFRGDNAGAGSKNLLLGARTPSKALPQIGVGTNNQHNADSAMSLRDRPRRAGGAQSADVLSGMLGNPPVARRPSVPGGRKDMATKDVQVFLHVSDSSSDDEYPHSQRQGHRVNV